MLNHIDFTNKYALEEIGYEVDKRISQNAAEYRKRGKEDYLLNMFRKKMAKKISSRKKWKQHAMDIQIANHAMRINPTSFSERPDTSEDRSRKPSVQKKVQKKGKATAQKTSMKKKKKSRLFSRVPTDPIVLENDFFRNVRNSLEYFARKKKEFLLSVLTLYKEMEALDLSDLKSLLEMKFIEVTFKNSLPEEENEIKFSALRTQANNESGDKVDNKQLEQEEPKTASLTLPRSKDSASSVSSNNSEKSNRVFEEPGESRETKDGQDPGEVSQVSFYTYNYPENTNVPPNSAMTVTPLRSETSHLSNLDSETEKRIDQALSSLIAKKTEIVKMKSKFNMSEGVLKNANHANSAGNTKIPDVVFKVGSRTTVYSAAPSIFKRGRKKTFG
ncbi:uncharacterized protein LOC106668287 isoform X2 [Cimex lectularius]|uniref:Uncharacterized protein n=1 Tax=Cimex lectularius TaxID=79782 RepID=A0A8I6RYW3_CIMLE|nr:uncharacterized protein LOC106668287 isoform X2 [Cimex lectularius]